MVYCSAFGCSNSNTKVSCKEAKISFHRFPLKDQQLLLQWHAKIRRQNFVANDYSVLCSQHFEKEDFVFQPFTGRRQLKKGAVPSKFCHLPVKTTRKKTKYEFGMHTSNKENEVSVHIPGTCDVGCQTEETEMSKLLKLLEEKDETIRQLKIKNTIKKQIIENMVAQ